MENNTSTNLSQVLITNLPDGVSLLFSSLEYTELAGGVLPLLTLEFVDEHESFPIGELHNLDVEIHALSDFEASVKVTIDEIQTSKGKVITFFTTVALQDFYYNTKVNQYITPKDALDSLFPGDVIYIGESPISSEKIEINQTAISDYKMLNIILRSMISPSMFSYTMEGLKITNLDTTTIKELDIKHTTLDIDNNRQRLYPRNKLYEIGPEGFKIHVDGDSVDRAYTYNLIGKKFQTNSTNKSHIDHFLGNSLFFADNLSGILSITSERSLGISSGDIVSLIVPEKDTIKYVVMSRMMMLSSTNKFNYTFKEMKE